MKNASPDTNEANQKKETLFGGRAATALHEDGTAKEIKVRQIRLADYEKAYSIFLDEFAFTAFCCINEKGAHFARSWALTLTPESYEELRAAAKEVNEKGFFSYALRRDLKDQQLKAQFIANMPEDMLRKVMDIGNEGSISSTASPRPRPMPT